MLLVDVHAHLDLTADLPAVLERAKSAGVKSIISNGVNPVTNRVTLELAKTNPLVKAAIGIYPTEAALLTGHEITEELDFISKHKSSIVGIGEIGLDYLKTEDKVIQTQIFRQQLEMAHKIGKPVIVHSRKAESDVTEILSSYKLKVIMHCCMGNMKVIKKGLDQGFLYSIPALVNKSSHFQALVERASLSQLLTETDAPFLSPDKDLRSEPAMVRGSIEQIASIKKITPEECANIIFSNYQKTFK